MDILIAGTCKFIFIKGNEYIFNPDTGTTELIKPVIETGRMSGRDATHLIKEITEEWEKYLESKETDKTTNR